MGPSRIRRTTRVDQPLSAGKNGGGLGDLLRRTVHFLGRRRRRRDQFKKGGI